MYSLFGIGHVIVWKATMTVEAAGLSGSADADAKQ